MFTIFRDFVLGDVARELMGVCFGYLAGILKAITTTCAESHLVRDVFDGHTTPQTFLELSTVDVSADT